MTTKAKEESFQPVSDLQLNQLQVEWIPATQIQPNAYNPNRMTWHDRQLLKTSLLEDGWTQPIVTLPDGIIVDGEQRWTVAGEEVSPQEIQGMIDKMHERRAEGHDISDSIIWRLEQSKARLEEAIAAGHKPTLAAITGGLVPRTIIDLGDDAHKMISTIRHNRARGTHQIDAMAGITADLVQLGLDLDDLESRLGMDDEEVSRFLEMQQREADAMLDQLDGFGQAWEPVGLGEYEGDDEFIQSLDQSAGAAEAQEEYERQKAERKTQIDAEVESRIKAAEKAGGKLTQKEREDIRKAVEKGTPEVSAPKAPTLKKLLFFVTPDEYKLVVEVLGETAMAKELMILCEWAKAQGYADTRSGAKAN